MMSKRKMVHIGHLKVPTEVVELAKKMQDRQALIGVKTSLSYALNKILDAGANEIRVNGENARVETHISMFLSSIQEAQEVGSLRVGEDVIELAEKYKRDGETLSTSIASIMRVGCKVLNRS